MTLFLSRSYLPKSFSAVWRNVMLGKPPVAASSAALSAPA
jgi:hypothetical protein